MTELALYKITKLFEERTNNVYPRQAIVFICRFVFALVVVLIKKNTLCPQDVDTLLDILDND